MNKKELGRIVRSLEGYKIILKKEEYRKEGRKNFSKNPSETTTRKITVEEYDNIFSSIDFFKSLGGNERIYKNYTLAGYIPTKLVSISPDKEIKIIRNISIERY